MSIENNDKARLLPARPRLRRWLAWAVLVAPLAAASLALSRLESSTAQGALALLFRLLWA